MVSDRRVNLLGGSCREVVLEIALAYGGTGACDGRALVVACGAVATYGLGAVV